MTDDAYEEKKRTGPLNIAFESGRLSYSDLDVDLYNSGVNQILSEAASRGHRLYHFSMDDLMLVEGIPTASFTVLDAIPSADGDGGSTYRNLKPICKRIMPMKEIELYFVRGDDIKPQTGSVPILAEAEKDSLFLEKMQPTLDTCDKYELVKRCPHIPQPVTYSADTLEDALRYSWLIPQSVAGKLVLKDRFGYGCGAQVHLLDREDPGFIDRVSGYVDEYRHVLLQEFCPEVLQGDIVVTFFDREMIAPMKRRANPKEWKTNASLGGTGRDI